MTTDELLAAAFPQFGSYDTLLPKYRYVLNNCSQIVVGTNWPAGPSTLQWVENGRWTGIPVRVNFSLGDELDEYNVRFSSAIDAVPTHSDARAFALINCDLVGHVRSCGVFMLQYCTRERTRDGTYYRGHCFNVKACSPILPWAAQLNPRWKTEATQQLAKIIWEHRAYDRLPILRDALLDADCDNEVILHRLQHLPESFFCTTALPPWLLYVLMRDDNGEYFIPGAY